MNGVDVYVLARRLLKLGEAAIPGAGIHRLPASVVLVLMDVSANPNTSISQIVDRVGFPQSLVSGAVKRLEAGGALVTQVDERDRRRTLVRVAADVRRRAAKVPSRPLSEVVGEALRTSDRAEIDEAVVLLTRLGELFEAAEERPAPPTN